MAEFRARIGRVRMKNGGADVRVLERPPINADGENWCGKVIENAKAVASYSTPESPLVGYLLLGIYADGRSSFGFSYDPDRILFPRSLFPAWVAELVRRDMVTKQEAKDTFNEMFEWRDR